jgi:hypothetical protein
VMLNFINGYFCIYYNDHVIFPLGSSCALLCDLNILNHPYIFGMKITCSWCMIFLLHCWIQSARILLKIFASMFITEIDL